MKTVGLAASCILVCYYQIFPICCPPLLSAYSSDSVKSSPWKNGTGDVVGELAAAVNRGGLKMGVYLSPWDRHDPSYADISAYNEHYLGQMRELLSK